MLFSKYLFVINVFDLSMTSFNLKTSRLDNKNILVVQIIVLSIDVLMSVLWSIAFIV